MSDFLSYDEASAYLRERGAGISTSTLQRLVSQRRIAFHKIGWLVRFTPDDLDAYVSSTRVEPTIVGIAAAAPRSVPRSSGSTRIGTVPLRRSAR